MAVVTITGSDVSGGSPSGGGVGGASNLTTAGAVPYVASAGVLTQAATGLFYDSANVRLGVGTGSPNFTLTVASAGAFGQAQITGTSASAYGGFNVGNNAGTLMQIGTYGTGAANASEAFIYGAAGVTALRLWTADATAPIKFIPGNTERARFAATTGNLLIGTTTDDGSSRLQAQATSTQILSLYNGNWSSGVSGSYLRFGFGATTGSTYSTIQAASGGGASGALLAINSAGGNTTVGGTTDGNYKLDIAASGSSGTLRVKDSTPTTGATSMLVDIGAAQTAASTVLTLNGVMKYAGTNSTGAGSALLGANSPASTLTAPYTWITVITSDGSTGFIPVWK